MQLNDVCAFRFAFALDKCLPSSQNSIYKMVFVIGVTVFASHTICPFYNYIRCPLRIVVPLFALNTHPYHHFSVHTFVGCLHCSIIWKAFPSSRESHIKLFCFKIEPYDWMTLPFCYLPLWTFGLLCKIHYYSNWKIKAKRNRGLTLSLE